MPNLSFTHPLLLPQGELSLRKLVKLALCLVLGIAALTLSAKLNVPIRPIPFTMQTFAVLVLGAAYGRYLGVATVAGYLILGTIGLPLFAKGGGLMYLTMPTGGYLLGFLPAAYIAGIMGERGLDRRLTPAIAGFAIAHTVIFICGLAWLQHSIGFAKAVSVGLYPFIPGAVIKFSAATGVMLLLWRLKHYPNKDN